MDSLTTVTLLLDQLARTAAIGALITKARTEGRDITSAELEELKVQDDTARAALVDAIAKARAEGR